MRDNPAPPGCPVARIRCWFGNFAFTRPVVRISEKWVTVRCNAMTVENFNRQVPSKGLAAGSGNAKANLPNVLTNLDEIEAFAEEHGGTWNSGWKAKRQ